MSVDNIKNMYNTMFISLYTKLPYRICMRFCKIRALTGEGLKALKASLVYVFN